MTDRDVVVAELIPPREGRAERVDDVHLAELVREGVVDPPALGRGSPPPRRPTVPLSELLRGLSGDREDR